MQAVYKETDAAFIAEAQANGNYQDGTTAVTVLISGTDLFCANAGDSKALLVRFGASMPLSKEHKPGDKAERARIEAAEGKVQFINGVARVKP